MVSVAVLTLLAVEIGLGLGRGHAQQADQTRKINRNAVHNKLQRLDEVVLGGGAVQVVLAGGAVVGTGATRSPAAGVDRDSAPSVRGTTGTAPRGRGSSEKTWQTSE
ncbi:hypothetical protein GCM10029963_69090 [Micromonospora andamanensis]|nr:hypothetical protein Vwe01_60520 [Micromonospora andamanensis]